MLRSLLSRCLTWRSIRATSSLHTGANRLQESYHIDVWADLCSWSNLVPRAPCFACWHVPGVLNSRVISRLFVGRDPDAKIFSLQLPFKVAAPPKIVPPLPTPPGAMRPPAPPIAGNYGLGMMPPPPPPPVSQPFELYSTDATFLPAVICGRPKAINSAT